MEPHTETSFSDDTLMEVVAGDQKTNGKEATKTSETPDAWKEASTEVPLTFADTTNWSEDANVLPVELRFRVPNSGEYVHFTTTVIRNVPETLCQPGMATEILAKHLDTLIIKCGQEQVIKQHAFKCWFCEGSARLLMSGVSTFLLHRRPPVVNQLSLPFCNTTSLCFEKAIDWSIRASRKVPTTAVKDFNTPMASRGSEE